MDKNQDRQLHEGKISSKKDIICKFNLSNEKMPVIPKSPLQSTNYDLILTNRELDAIKDNMKEKEKLYNLHSADMKEKWSQLKREQKFFEEVMAKKNNLLKESGEKCEEMKNQTDVELKQNEKFEKMIMELKSKLEIQSIQETELERSISRTKPFKMLLEDLIGEIDDFVNIHELINQYNVLSSTREDLIESLNENIKEIDKMKSTMTNLIQEKLILLTGEHRKQAQLDLENRQKTADLLEWEETADYLKQKTAENEKNILEVKSACYNLYRMIKRKKKIPCKLQENDIIGQLIFIKNALLEYAQMVQIANMCKDEENMLSLKPLSSNLREKRDI